MVVGVPAHPFVGLVLTFSQDRGRRLNYVTDVQANLVRDAVDGSNRRRKEVNDDNVVEVRVRLFRVGTDARYGKCNGGEYRMFSVLLRRVLGGHWGLVLTLAPAWQTSKSYGSPSLTPGSKSGWKIFFDATELFPGAIASDPFVGYS